MMENTVQVNIQDRSNLIDLNKFHADKKKKKKKEKFSILFFGIKKKKDDYKFIFFYNQC